MNLHLLQISDSALPIGGYAHSWGLEAALARGLVRDAASLEAWVRGWLWYALAPMEGVLVGAACRASREKQWEQVTLANEVLEASLVAPSLRTASREMGEQMLALAGTWEWSAAGVTTAARQSGGNLYHHAVVFGLLGALAGASPVETLTLYLHQAALGMIGAGVRAVPVGHTHGQQILAYLHGDILNLGQQLAERDVATAGSYCPFYEVLCDEQTRLYARVFRS